MPLRNTVIMEQVAQALHILFTTDTKAVEFPGLRVEETAPGVYVLTCG